MLREILEAKATFLEQMRDFLELEYGELKDSKLTGRALKGELWLDINREVAVTLSKTLDDPPLVHVMSFGKIIFMTLLPDEPRAAARIVTALIDAAPHIIPNLMRIAEKLEDFFSRTNVISGNQGSYISIRAEESKLVSLIQINPSAASGQPCFIVTPRDKETVAPMPASDRLFPYDNVDGIVAYVLEVAGHGAD